MTKRATSTTPRRKTQASAAAQQAPALKQHTLLWNRPGFLIRRLHQIHVAVFLEEMLEDNVTPIQYGLLSVLADSPGLDQLSLAEELGIDRANVADVLNRLETRGLVSRTPSKEDKRRKLCFPTPAGLAFVHKHFENMQRAQERILYPLDPAERREFMRLLQKVVEANNDLGRAPMRANIRQASAEHPEAETEPRNRAAKHVAA